MAFSTVTFLFGFLGLFLVVYHTIPRRFAKARNLFTLAASYAFYLWGAPRFVPLLLLSTVADYILGMLAGRPSRKKLALSASLILNLGLLGYFKYTNFLSGEVAGLLSLLGFNSPVLSQIALPLGISFFTFQKISYVVDIYRGEAKPQRDFAALALYVALFPKLIAGPIVPYHDMARQLTDRQQTVRDTYEGVIRFCFGLGKKVVIADAIGTIADSVFKVPGSSLALPVAWLGMLCYTFQLYFDFSGYSDMAIGLGRMIGFSFPENFNSPYISGSIQEFWRRWHMSLTGWLRNYLYIPLGGNRLSALRTYANLWIVFLATGLWHGANWTFIFWGFYHGALLTAQRLTAGRTDRRIPALLAVPGTFVLVALGWVFFRADSISAALGYVAALFDFNTLFSAQDIPFLMNNKSWVLLGLAALLSFCPYWIERRRMGQPPAAQRPHPGYASGFVAVVTLIYSIIVLSGSTYNPFIYSRF